MSVQIYCSFFFDQLVLQLCSYLGCCSWNKNGSSWVLNWIDKEPGYPCHTNVNEKCLCEQKIRTMSSVWVHSKYFSGIHTTCALLIMVLKILAICSCGNSMWRMIILSKGNCVINFKRKSYTSAISFNTNFTKYWNAVISGWWLT